MACLLDFQVSHMGKPTAAPCGPTRQNVVSPTRAAQVGPTLQPTWAPSGSNVAFPLGYFHVGLIMDPSLFSYRYNLGIPTWAFPSWSQLGPTFIFTCNTLGHFHLGTPTWGSLFFHTGTNWVFPLGHSHVGPNWGPHLFSYGIHLGTPTWAFPCWSQLRPTSFFTWDILGHAYVQL